MVFHRYMSAAQAKKISTAMKGDPLINSKTDVSDVQAIDFFLGYVEYELLTEALKGNTYYRLPLSENSDARLKEIIDELENKGYKVVYEKFDDFRSDPPYAVGELKISW